MSQQGGSAAKGAGGMTQVWRDGCWQKAELPLLSPLDGGWLFGDSLFETLLMRGNRPLLLDRHLDRLELSAHLSAMPFDRKSSEALIATALAQTPYPTARLRLTLSRGVSPGLAFPATGAEPLLTIAPYAEPTPEQRTTGWRAVAAPNQRVNPVSHLPQMKRGNYADCLYACNHARSCGADEALFFTPENRVLEGSISNLFLIRGDRLLTPHLGGLVLAGVIRSRLLQLAEGCGLQAGEAELTEAELFDADEVLVCNSLLLIMPLVELDGRPLQRGERWRDLLATLEYNLA